MKIKDKIEKKKICSLAKPLTDSHNFFPTSGMLDMKKTEECIASVVFEVIRLEWEIDLLKCAEINKLPIATKNFQSGINFSDTINFSSMVFNVPSQIVDYADKHGIVLTSLTLIEIRELYINALTNHKRELLKNLQVMNSEWVESK